MKKLHEIRIILRATSIPEEINKIAKIIMSPNPSLSFKEKIENIKIIKLIIRQSSTENSLNKLSDDRRTEKISGKTKIVEKELNQKSSKLISKKKNRKIVE